MHELLADLALATVADCVLDLGGGEGDTLAEISRRSPQARLIAVDINGEALAVLSARLSGSQIVRHDLAEPLPFADETVDVVVSHNVLECLLDPPALLTEIARVVRPGGRVVLGHTDFETIVVASPDRELTRRVLLTYAELPVLYEHMACADAQMGRRLAGLVRRSPLSVQTIEAHTTVLPSLAEAWTARLEEVEAAVRRSASVGRGHVEVTELERWIEQLHAAQASGEFLFSETAYVVTATRGH